MNMNIEFVEKEMVLINGKIFAEGSLSAFEMRVLVEEYEKLGIKAQVYTPLAMEKICNLPSAIASHFQRMERGNSMGYNQYTIEKVSLHLCQIQGLRIVQMNEHLKVAV